MLRNIHRIILILMLALVMVSGSFIVSMANTSDIPSSDSHATSEESNEEVSGSDSKETVVDVVVIKDDNNDSVPGSGETASSSTKENADKATSDTDNKEIVKTDSKYVADEVSDISSSTASNLVIPEGDSSDKKEASSDYDNPEQNNKSGQQQVGNGDVNNENDIIPNGSGKQDDSTPQNQKNEDNEEFDPKTLHPEVNFDEVVNVGGHRVSYFIDNYVAATCDSEGSYDLVRRCRNKDCSYTNGILSADRGITIPAFGHDFHEVEGSSIEPTCTVPGKHADIICSRCGTKEVGAEIPSLGHEMGEWSAWKEVRQATTTSEGLKEHYRYCNICGHMEKETVVVPILETKHHPTYVSISDNGSIYMAEVDENKNVRFKDILWTLDADSSAEESVIMTLNGRSYSFIRYANGRVVGSLPQGFKIVGNDIIISGVNGPLSINFQHYATSHEFADMTELSSTNTAVGGTFTAPVSTSRIPIARNYTGNQRVAVAIDTNARYSNSIADAFDAALNGDNAAVNNKKDNNNNQAASPILPSVGSESESKNILSPQTNGLAAYLLLIIDLALGLGLVIGLGVLWKMKVIKF